MRARIDRHGRRFTTQPYLLCQDSALCFHSRAVPNGGVRKNMFQLLSQFRIIVDIFIGIVAQTSLTFLEPSAQIHVTNFFPNVSPSKMGLLFMLAILCYAAMAPFAGWVSDTRFGRHPVMSCGLFLISVGLYMFGPIGWPFTVPSMGSLIGGLAVVRFAPLFALADFRVTTCPHTRVSGFELNLIYPSRGQVGLGMGAATVPIVPDIIESAGAGNEETASGMAGLFTCVGFFRLALLFPLAHLCLRAPHVSSHCSNFTRVIPALATLLVRRSDPFSFRDTVSTRRRLPFRLRRLCLPCFWSFSR
jgi:hypothetical protein